MIKLFDYFNDHSRKLYESFKASKLEEDLTIVLNDNGFLPDDVISPYQFFADNHNTENMKPRFFNQVTVPAFWEIKGNNNSATINDMGRLRGKIFYQSGERPRIVSRVEWFDDQQRVRFVDYYSKNGIKFAQTVYDLNRKAILKKYMTAEGKEVIYENFVTSDVILDWQGKSYFFPSKLAFVLFFIKQLEITEHHFVINSLALPFSVLYNLPSKGSDVLVWQEHCNGNVPGNMQLMCKGDMKRHCNIIIPDKNEYETMLNIADAKVQSRILQGGYLYNYRSSNRYTKEIVILTNSDQLRNIKVLVETLPDFNFHIAAITEMSDKLMQLDQYANVHLYPSINIDRVNELYQLCDIYLDINEGNEILNAVEQAFDYELLILGYRQTAHHAKVTLSEHLFEHNDEITMESKDQLIQMLESLKDQQQFRDALLAQKAHAHEISREQFEQVFKQALES